MAFENPLKPISDNHMITSECLSLVRRSTGRRVSDAQLPRGMENVSGGQIDVARQELNNLYVVALWATFERTIIEYVQGATIEISNRRPQRFVKAFNEKLVLEIERWRVDELLDLLNTFVDSKFIGQVKQIKQFRDGIVHRNPRTTPDSTVRPDHAFRIMSIVLQAMHDA